MRTIVIPIDRTLQGTYCNVYCTVLTLRNVSNISHWTAPFLPSTYLQQQTQKVHNQLLNREQTWCMHNTRSGNSFPKVLLFRSLHVTNKQTPWRRVLPEKLTDLQLVKKFSGFYENRRFITVFTTAHHLSLSSARSIQPMSPSHSFVDPF